MNGDVDHVRWLREQASRHQSKSEEATIEKEGKARANTARRLRDAASALELALVGVDPGAMGGHAGLLKRLRPGARVRVQLMTGERLVGEIRAMGRYDFALLLESGQELVVAKHAVAYWVLLGEEVDDGEIAGGDGGAGVREAGGGGGDTESVAAG